MLFRSLGAWASVVVAHGLSSCGLQALEHRLSSCGAQALLLRSMWDLPGPGLEPVSPALASGFLTTAPPGKSSVVVSYIEVQISKYRQESGHKYVVRSLFVSCLRRCKPGAGN